MNGQRLSFHECDKTFLEQSFGSGRPAVDYLAGYLSEIGAAGAVAEHHYVDRHFLDDFAEYYARSFKAPEVHCARVHFFRISGRELLRVMGRAHKRGDDAQRARGELQAAYLGFIVRKPLPGASIGRTVLVTYPPPRRRYEVVRPYHVNLAGLRLTVNGLAYQEQDQGAAVCASTSLWSALQRVAYVAGNRTPTPSMITRAAGSPFPASAGLDLQQMARALSALGYVADFFTPDNNLALFRVKLGACLRSQLPVILVIYKRTRDANGTRMAGHAVTVTGYSEPPSGASVSITPGLPPFEMRTATIQTIYVHDDNLGSHAHYELRDSDETDALGNRKLLLFRGDSNRSVSWWKPDEWEIAGALVPKAPKMRLAVESLVNRIAMARAISSLAFPKLAISFDVRLCSGTSYLEDVASMSVDDEDRFSFHARLTLPRYVGVVSLFHGETHLADLLLDVSEVHRMHIPARILAIVAPGVSKSTPAAQNLLLIGAQVQAPVLTAVELPPEDAVRRAFRERSQRFLARNAN